MIQRNAEKKITKYDEGTLLGIKRGLRRNSMHRDQVVGIPQSDGHGLMACEFAPGRRGMRRK